MKNKKILLIVFIAIATILSNIGFVYADSYNVSMQPDKQNYAPGQTVEVTVALANVESSGIYGLSGYIAYSEDIFEEIEYSTSNGSTDNITSLNGWGSITFGPGDPSIIAGNPEIQGKFTIVSTTPLVTGTQSIMKIKLKIKEGAPLGKATIQLMHLEASNNDIDIAATNAAIGVNIQNASDIGGEEIPPVTSPTPSPEPSQAPSPAPSPVQQNSPKPNNGGSSSNGGNKLPQTGLAKDVILPIIIGAVIISGVSFIAYRKYKDI